MPKPLTIAASEARNNFSDLVSKVQYQGQEYLVERYGEVVAKIVPVQIEIVAEGDEDADEKMTEKQVPPKEQVQTVEQISQREQTVKYFDEEKPDQLKPTTTQFSHRQVSSMGRTIGMPSFSSSIQEPAMPFDRENATTNDGELSSQPQTTTTESQFKQTEPVASEQKNDSGWSALRKLEELIAAQRAKATHQTSTTSEQSERTEQDYERDEQPIAEQTSQNYQSQQIIRKKIEL